MTYRMAIAVAMTFGATGAFVGALSLLAGGRVARVTSTRIVPALRRAGVSTEGFHSRARSTSVLGYGGWNADEPPQAVQRMEEVL